LGQSIVYTIIRSLGALTHPCIASRHKPAIKPGYNAGNMRRGAQWARLDRSNARIAVRLMERAYGDRKRSWRGKGSGPSARGKGSGQLEKIFAPMSIFVASFVDLYILIIQETLTRCSDQERARKAADS
jgi:hypothetical protein